MYNDLLGDFCTVDGSQRKGGGQSLCVICNGFRQFGGVDRAVMAVCTCVRMR